MHTKQEGDIIAYSQQDPRWRDIKLGNSKTWTIGQGGCLLTAMCNVAMQYGHNLNPAQLNQKFLELGLYVGDGDINGGTALTTAFPDICYQGYIDMPATIDKNVLAIQNQLGVEGILKLDYSPTAGLQTHYCRLRGLDVNNWVVMDDSWDGERCLVKDRYLKDETKMIYGVTLYYKSPTTTTTTKTTTTTHTTSTSSSHSTSTSHSTSLSSSTSTSESTSTLTTTTTALESPQIPWHIVILRWLLSLIGRR